MRFAAQDTPEKQKKVMQTCYANQSNSAMYSGR